MSNWKKYKLKDLGDIITGSTPKTSIDEYWENGDILFVSPGDMKGDKFIRDTERKVSLSGAASVRMIPANSVMVTCIGSTIGKMALSSQGCVTNQQINTIVPKQDYDSNYIYYALLNNTNIFEKLKGTTAVPIINKSNFQSLEIMVPSLKEQQKIADILSSVDAAIEKTEQVIAKTEEVKKGLMQQLLTKGIGHKEFKQTEIGEIPVKWIIKKLNEVATFSQGLQVPLENQYTESNNSNIRFLRIVDYTQSSTEARYIDLVDNKYIVKVDEVVMVRYGATAGYVGRGMAGVIANNLFRISPEGILLNDYLYLFLKQEKIFNILNKSTGASAMPAVNFSQVGNLKIAVPPLSEQRRIYDIVNKIEESIVMNNQKLDKLLDIKKGLMQQLLTGQVRVKV